MLTDENKVIAFLSPRLFGEGSKSSLWVQTDVLLVLPNRRLRIRRFTIEKRMHGIPCLTAFVAFLPFRYWVKKMVFISFGKGRVFQEKGKSFLRKTLNPFLCLQFPPYLYIFSVLI